MNAELINAISDVSQEAIKILGPAFITAYFAYRIGKTQIEVKLKEAEEKHKFGAREHLFNYYKERLSKLMDSYAKLSESLGQILGFTAVGTVNVQFDITMAKLANFYLRVLPHDIKLTMRDLEKNNLKDTEEYNALSEYLKKVSSVSLANDIESLRDNTLFLLEIIGYLSQSNHILLEQQAHSALQPYAK